MAHDCFNVVEVRSLVCNVGECLQGSVMVGTYSADQLGVGILMRCGYVGVGNEDQASDSALGVVCSVANHVVGVSAVKRICNYPVSSNVMLFQTWISTVRYIAIIRNGVAKSSINLDILFVLRTKLEVVQLEFRNQVLAC